MGKAKTPKASFVSDPWISLTDLDFLSPSILVDIDDKLQFPIADGKSVGDLVREGVIKVNESGYYAISLEFDYFETSLIEQFRADFNDDGIEEVFVSGWQQVVGGPMGFAFTSYFTRRSAKSLMEPL